MFNFGNMISKGIQSVGDTINSVNPLEKLQSLGVNTDEIDKQVDTDIQKTKDNTISKQELGDLFKQVGPDESKRGVVLQLIDNGYSIEGFDASTIKNKEIGEKPGKINKTETSDTALGIGINAITPKGGFMSGIKSLDDKLAEGEKNFGKAAIAGIPSVLGNFIGFFAKAGGEGVEGIANKFKDEENKTDIGSEIGDEIINLGNLGEDKLNKILGTDTKTWSAQAGSYLPDIASMFVGGEANAGTKIKEIINKSPEAKNILMGTISLIEKSPKIQKLLNVSKSTLTGLKETAKFQIASEGTLDETGLVIGAVANPILQKGGELLSNSAPKLLRKITGVKTKQIKDKGLATLQKDEELVTAGLKDLGEKTDSFEGMLGLLNKRGKQLYTKYINPKIAKADSLVNKVNLKGTTDNVIDELSIKIGDTTKYAGGISDDILKNEIKDFKSIEKGIKSFKDLESFKLYISSQLKSGGLPANVKPLYEKLNQNLQTKYDDLLEKTLGKGEGISNIKREYAALQNMKEGLYAKVAKELRDNGGGLIEQYGYFGAIQQAIKGESKESIKTLLATDILKKLRDPQADISKFFKELYKKPGIIGDKAIGIGSTETGKGLNDYVNK